MFHSEKIKREAARLMNNSVEDFIDSCCEIDCTTMAESVCDELNLYEGEDFDIPEWLFDLAVDVGSNFLGREET